jgi:hypothetical protein
MACYAARRPGGWGWWTRPGPTPSPPGWSKAPTRRVVKEVGEEYWRRADGGWVDVEVAGEYEEPVPAWEHFGYDMAGIGPWFDAMPWRDCDELVDETDEWDVRRNGAGAALKYWKHKSGARLVFASDHSISPNTRYDSYCDALQVYREHMLY